MIKGLIVITTVALTSVICNVAAGWWLERILTGLFSVS